MLKKKQRATIWPMHENRCKLHNVAFSHRTTLKQVYTRLKAKRLLCWKMRCCDSHYHLKVDESYARGVQALKEAAEFHEKFTIWCCLMESLFVPSHCATPEIDLIIHGHWKRSVANEFGLLCQSNYECFNYIKSAWITAVYNGVETRERFVCIYDTIKDMLVNHTTLNSNKFSGIYSCLAALHYIGTLIFHDAGTIPSQVSDEKFHKKLSYVDLEVLFCKLMAWKPKTFSHDQLFDNQSLISQEQKFELLEVLQQNSIKSLEQTLDNDSELADKLPLVLGHDNSRHLQMLVRREHVLVDTIEFLKDLDKTNREHLIYVNLPLKIVFVNEESAVDVGGPRNEYFGLLQTQLFHGELAEKIWKRYEQSDGTFVRIPQRSGDVKSALNSESAKSNKDLFRFWVYIGCIFGMLLYNGNWNCLNQHFPLNLLVAMFRNQPISADQIRRAFPRQAKLVQTLDEKELTSWSGDVLALQSSVSDVNIEYGEVEFEEWFPCTGNYDKYMWALLGCPKVLLPESKHFQLQEEKNPFANHAWPGLLDGLDIFYWKGNGFMIWPDEVIQSKFSPHADPSDNEWITVQNICRSTTFEGWNTEQHSTYLAMFWITLHRKFTRKQLWYLLQFITGDIEIIRKLQSKETKLTIVHYEYDGTKASAPLPTAQTCFHTLRLPVYQSLHELRTKLQIIIDNWSSFGLA